MAFFHKLNIKDFQSHKNSIVEFDRHVTAIIGLNNHGKSAILKALRKLVRNEPSGNAFVRNLPDTAKFTSIKLFIDSNDTNNVEIERRVGTNSTVSVDNMYRVQLSEDNKYEFTKFSKTGIPEEVLSSLGVSAPQVFGDLEIDLNFHVQKDEDFLVRGKGLASIRSKILSRITGVDIAQRAVQIGRLREKSYNQEIDKSRELQQECKLQLSKYEEVDAIESFLQQQLQRAENLKLLYQDIEHCRAALDNVQRIIAAASRAKQLSTAATITLDLDRLHSLRDTLSLLYRLHTALARITYLENIKSIVAIKVDTDQLKDNHLLKEQVTRTLVLQKQISVLDNVQACIRPVNLQALIDKRDSISELKKLDMRLREIEQQIVRKDQESEKVTELLNTAKTDLDNYKKELQVCPVCERPF